MTAGLFELAVVVLTAAFLGFLAKLLRQPIVLAYLGTGLIFGAFNLFNIQDGETFSVFSSLGVMFLLFLVGLEINYASLKIVGRAAAIIGLAQVLLTSLLGFALAAILGYDALTSGYIGLGLAFSSTILVVKLLSEKRDLNSLYGRIAVGVLLVQDFIAILLLVILAGVQTANSMSWIALLMTVLKGLGLFALMLWLGRKFLPFIFGKISKSQELLFLFTLAWVFLLAALVSRIGFSVEIAGFLAGLALANSAEQYQIAAKIRPLRDFFILIFFVILGSSVVLWDFEGLVLPIALFIAFTVIFNPLIVTAVMGFMGYRKRTSFLTGLTMSQVSEFSLLLIGLGYTAGHVDQSAVSVMTAVAIGTMILSSYFITHGERIHDRMSGKILGLFERREAGMDHELEATLSRPIILIGAHRVGQNVALSLPPENILVIDSDPEAILEMKQYNYDYLFGDVLDPEIFRKAHFESARLVISTNPDIHDNLALMNILNSMEARPKTIIRAETEDEAQMLYREGADYVLLPHFTSGQYLGKTIAVDPDANILEHLKQRDLEMMRKKSLRNIN